MVPPWEIGHLSIHAIRGCFPPVGPSGSPGEPRAAPEHTQGRFPLSPSFKPWSLGPAQKEQTGRGAPGAGPRQLQQDYMPAVSLAPKANWKNPTAPTAVQPARPPPLHRQPDRGDGAAGLRLVQLRTSHDGEEGTGLIPEERMNGRGQGCRRGGRLAGARWAQGEVGRHSGTGAEDRKSKDA